MDVTGSIAAIKTAFEDSVTQRNNGDVIAAAWAALYFTGGFVLSVARVLGTAGPFGIAAVAAAGAGLNGVCCLLGAALGYIVSGGLSWGIRYLAAIVIVFTVEFSFQDTRLYKNTLFGPITAAAVTLATGVLSSFSQILSDAPTIAVVFLETVLAFGVCFFIEEALNKEEPTTESAEVRHSSAVLITVAVLMMALSRLELFGVLSVGRFAALLIIMTSTLRCGMMTGCTVGTVFGIAMDLTGGATPFFTMAYAFSGLIAGLFSRCGRLAFLLSFILSNAVTAALVWSAAPQLNDLVEVFCAAVVFMLLPSGIISRVGTLIQPVSGGSGESGLRRYVSRRVAQLASAYEGLFEIVRRNVEVKHNDADPSKVFDRAADSVCVMCRDKNRCWNSEYMDTLSALNDANAAMTKRGTLQLGDIPCRFVEKCRTPEAFVTAVNGELRAAAYRKHFAAQLRESRDTAWGQYSDMADILGNVAEELGSINGADHLAERRLMRYLRSMDIEADAAVYRDGRGRLRAVVESGSLSRLYDEPDYLEKLSAVLGLRLCRQKAGSDGTAKLTLIEAEPLAVSVGIAAMKKKGEKVSGDRGTYFKTDSGVLCVILSDGMGCGPEAASESKEVIEILEKFLRSGIDPAVAMKTLNSVMLLKSGDNWGFATVDLMCVDLFSGETCFYKYGAAPSYVMNGKSIRRIKGESFAPGLGGGSSAAPDVVRMRLKPGSTAIIASDGVIGDSNDSWLREIMDSATDDMKLLARDTLREAEKIYGNCDDMTVLAVKVQTRG